MNEIANAIARELAEPGGAERLTEPAVVPAYEPRTFTLIIDYVPGQSWEAAFEGDQPTLGTGGAGWEADSPALLLAKVTTALRRVHRSPWELFSTTYNSAVRSSLAWYAGYMRGESATAQASYDAISADPEATARQDQSMVTTGALRHAALMFAEAADSADEALAAYKALDGGNEYALSDFYGRHGYVLTNALMVQSEHLRETGDAFDAAAADAADAARHEWEQLNGELDDDEPLDSGVQD